MQQRDNNVKHFPTEDSIQWSFVAFFKFTFVSVKSNDRTSIDLYYKLFSADSSKKDV